MSHAAILVRIKKKNENCCHLGEQRPERDWSIKKMEERDEGEKEG
jgi:hypothetical protein